MINSIGKLKEVMRGDEEVFYCKLKIVEVKKDKIRLEGDEGFFKPQLSAIKVK